MPYSKEHKQKTRNNIIESAYRLFSTKGYDKVTLDELMLDCSLTRGAFYAHFQSKSALYSEALKYAASNSALSKDKPKNVSNKEWLGQLLDIYLSVEHVNDNMPCPLAFLATDITSRNKATKATYTNTYKKMNELFFYYLKESSDYSEQQVLSLTSMIIGAVAVSRAVDDKQLVDKILSACREQTKFMLGEVKKNY